MSYLTNIRSDAENQLLVLEVINDAGTSFAEYGKVEIKLSDIRDLLPAAGVMPVDGTYDDLATIKLREVQICLADGSQAYVIGLFGAPYTKV